jgi:AcrR family transcriptional regulator
MTAETASPTTGEPDLRGHRPVDSGQVGRRAGTDRHEALVGAAAALVAEGDVESVSMESVAARAGVSRSLVYKHFANRHELLAAVYRREATALDTEIVRAVETAEGFEDIIRTLIRGVLAGAASRGATFARLSRAGARDARLRQEQRDRDRRTVRYFSRLAMTEFDLSKEQARAAIRILLTGVDSVLAQWHARPSVQQGRFLEDLYVDLVVGSLDRLASQGRERGAPRPGDSPSSVTECQP